MSQRYDENIVTNKLENKHVVERISQLVQLRLVECGWLDQIRLTCRNIIDEREDFLSVDEFIAFVTPTARSMVPDSVKRELLHELELILTNNSESKPSTKK